jgi:RNA polymerase sigma-70 factor (ECF subfamily)
MIVTKEKPQVQTVLIAANDLELIRRAQTGDREAFCDLVRLYRTGVINVIYRMSGSVDLAEDAAQQAFLSAWRHLSSYQPRASFRGWLYRIAVNAALDLLRREKPSVDIDLLPIPAPGADPERRVEQRERSQRVRQAVLSLPEASRAVLILREYETMSYEEIATALDIPVGTVMSRLSYARKLLTERLKGELEAV